MGTTILYYFIILLTLIVAYVLISHYKNFTRINTELTILQSEHPDIDTIDLLLDKKQPTIFYYEIELWDGYDLLIGETHANIEEVLKDNNTLISTLKTIYLKPYALPFTKDWKISLKQQTSNWENLIHTDTTPFTPLIQDKSMRLLGCLSGYMMLCIISPKHKHAINKIKNAKIDFRKYLIENGDIDKVEYITIPIRPCHIIYLPYGWFYFIYCGEENNYCSYLDMANETYLL
jgi:hypothetical protein